MKFALRFILVLSLILAGVLMPAKGIAGPLKVYEDPDNDGNYTKIASSGCQRLKTNGTKGGIPSPYRAFGMSRFRDLPWRGDAGAYRLSGQPITGKESR